MGASIDRIMYSRDMFDGVTFADSDIKGFDKKMSFTIHGRPITDSRPRHTKKGTHVYNPHKEELMQIFKGIYETCKDLQEFAAITPMAIVLTGYVKPDKKIVAMFGEEAINKEDVWCVKIKDNDNLEKVTWDVLSDDAFMMVLDDRYVVHNRTSKYYSFDDRLEVEIHIWDAYKHPGYAEIVKQSAAWAKFMMSRKYIEHIQGSPKEDVHKYFLINSLGVKLTEKTFTKYMGKVYPANLIDKIFYELTGSPSRKAKLIKVKSIYEHLNTAVHKKLVKEYRAQLGIKKGD